MVHPLPPGVRTETFTYSNGKEQTIYLAPFETEGPKLLVEDDRKVMYYMYAHYVFRWPQGTTQLSIGHGTIAKHIALWTEITIAGPWMPDTLAGFAALWTRAESQRHTRR